MIARSTEAPFSVNHDSIFRSLSAAPFVIHDKLYRNVGLMRIFPSISIESVNRGVISWSAVLKSSQKPENESHYKSMSQAIRACFLLGSTDLNISYEMGFFRYAVLPQLLCYELTVKSDVEMPNAFRENGANY
ncbi:hypothetical protein LOAG_00838 [Loa loa]|uniref:Uncharacterized protein n=1 Tax=Loa loa TaxID=7209 RepID=A0A1S0UA90_LOALO|nr:hypothetical protein LOAG_00838 [Loa loa]EFO27638.1 hypothetical protein LOAG_00838 [Loa loa]